jgi:sarcosine oxidase, subunit gamma
VTGEVAPRSPLAHRVADLERVTRTAGGAVEIAEIPLLAQVGLRVDPAVAERLGLSLPVEPNTHVQSDDEQETLWLGPDEWLVLGPPGAAPGIVGQLERRLAGSHHSVVDVSSNRATVELRGPARLELLSKGCSVDLRPTTWTSGACAQTLLCGAQVVLQERAGDTRIYIRPSFGDYLVDWVIDASTEYTGTTPDDRRE